MGKFKELIEAEQKMRLYLETETALCRAGFSYDPRACRWKRHMHAGDGTPVYAEICLCITGSLDVRAQGGGRRRGTYDMPAGILAADDAQAFLSWLDKTLEEWLAQARTPEEAAREKLQKTRAALIKAGFVQGRKPHCWELQAGMEGGGVLRVKLNLDTSILYTGTDGDRNGGACSIPKETREEGAERLAAWIGRRLEPYRPLLQKGKGETHGQI